MKCSVCENEARSLGLCEKHYIRYRKHGDPLGGTRNQGPLEERFAAKVDHEGAEGCWLWTGAKNSKGYGVIGAGGRDGKDLSAHRVAYEIAFGHIPVGLSVLHSCDNPTCVNPSHLRCGTARENISEAYQKKRKVSPFSKAENRYQGPRPSMPGAANPNSRLNDDAIRAIRASTDKPGKVAVAYNVTPDYITLIRKRKVWKHVE